MRGVSADDPNPLPSRGEGTLQTNGSALGPDDWLLVSFFRRKQHSEASTGSAGFVSSAAELSDSAASSVTRLKRLLDITCSLNINVIVASSSLTNSTLYS